jgi:hypothetical protein
MIGKNETNAKKDETNTKKMKQTKRIGEKGEVVIPFRVPPKGP